MPPPTPPIYWLPYLRFSTGIARQTDLAIGKGALLDDDDTTWAAIGCPRPTSFNVYRDFPFSIDPRDEGPAIRGSLITSSDTKWLVDNMSVIVAVLYFLGDNPRRSSPAERFRYYRVAMSPVFPDLAVHRTKKGNHYETGDSVRLYPPLELRGSRDRYELRIDTDWKKALLELLANDPANRVFKAIEHYFRSQFADQFMNPFIEDCAHLCACLEAALNVKSDSGQVGKETANAVGTVYGDTDKLPRWTRGLYTARSIHVHGETVAGADPEDSRIKDYYYYTSIPGRQTLVNHLCYDLIIRRICQVKGLDPLAAWPTMADDQVQQFLYAGDLWARIRRFLLQGGAARKLLAMIASDENANKTAEHDGKYAEFCKAAMEFTDKGDWQLIGENANKDQIFKCLETVSIVLGSLFRSTGPGYAISDALGKAVDRRDADAMRQWHLEHADWKITFLPTDYTDCFKSLAVQLAAFWTPA
jgi:hypothetical protein